MELTYPAIENVPFEAEEGLDDDNLRELQVVAEESTDLLDGKVYEFAAAIYNYLQSFSRHSSLTDQLMIDYQRSKTAATEAEKQYKKYVLLPRSNVYRTSFLSCFMRKNAQREGKDLKQVFFLALFLNFI